MVAGVEEVAVEGVDVDVDVVGFDILGINVGKR